MIKQKEIENFRQTIGKKYVNFIEQKLQKEKKLKLVGFTNEYFQQFDRCRDY